MGHVIGNPSDQVLNLFIRPVVKKNMSIKKVAVVGTEQVEELAAVFAKDGIVVISGPEVTRKMVDADVAIEAGGEDLETKQALLAELDRRCKADTILVSHTQSVPLKQLAAATRRPERCVSIWFDQPMTESDGVEVRYAPETIMKCFDIVVLLLQQLGKKTREIRGKQKN